MKYRFLSIIVPVIVIFIAAILYFYFAKSFHIPYFNILTTLVLGLFSAVLEIQITRRFPLNIARYISLDGKIFPFFSVGVAIGMIIHKDFSS